VNICVVGQGYVGLPISVHAARAGFKVYGYDIDKEKIDRLINGVTDSAEVSQNEILEIQSKGKLFFISELNRELEISIFVIAVPTPLNSYNEPEMKYLMSACEEIAKVIQSDTLIVNESTSFIGTLRDFIKPLIDKNSGSKGIRYAVAPERIDPGNKKWTIKNTPRIISGLNKDSINQAVDFYQNFCDIVYIVSSPEIAESAKLLENSFRQLNIALVNELSRLAVAYNFSLNDAVNAAATKPFGFMPFYPSIGVGGHCIPVDPSYLVYSAKRAGLDSSLINLANMINSKMPSYIVERIENYLGTSVLGKKIQIAGISYKVDIADTREAPAIKLLDMLRNLGAQVTWCDPVVATFNGEKSSILDPSIDLGLIVTPHKSIDFRVWKSAQTSVIDLSSNPLNFGWPKFL
jgi:UDP-N-acetyl-D-glucosamine dehydrogenase